MWIPELGACVWVYREEECVACMGYVIGRDRKTRICTIQLRHGHTVVAHCDNIYLSHDSVSARMRDEYMKPQ